MILPKTRVVAFAAAVAANLALTLSAGAAQAQAPHHGARLAAHQQALPMDARSTVPFGGLAMKHDTPTGADSDFSGFCDFSGANAC